MYTSSVETFMPLLFIQLYKELGCQWSFFISFFFTSIFIYFFLLSVFLSKFTTGSFLYGSDIKRLTFIFSENGFHLQDCRLVELTLDYWWRQKCSQKEITKRCVIVYTEEIHSKDYQVAKCVGGNVDTASSSTSVSIFNQSKFPRKSG